MNARVPFGGKEYIFENIDTNLTNEQLARMAAERFLQERYAQNNKNSIPESEQNPDTKSGEWEYAKGLATSIANGATGNLGSRIWGGLKEYFNDPSPHPFQTFGKSKEELKAESEYIKNKYEEGKKEYEAVNEDFKKNHKVSNVLGELAGGLSGALIPVGLGGKAVQGTKATATGIKALFNTLKPGAIYGGLYGAVTNAAEAENLASVDALGRAAIGSAKGALSGTIIAGLAGMGGSMFRSLTKTGQTKKFIKSVGKDTIEKSIETKTPVTELVGEEGMAWMENANLNSTKARDVFLKHTEKQTTKQIEKLNDSANKMFGNKTGDVFMEEVKAKANPEYTKFYNEAMKDGQLNTKIDLPQETIKEIARINEEINTTKGVLKELGFDPKSVKSEIPEHRWSTDLRTKLDDLQIQKSLLKKENVLENPYIADMITQVKTHNKTLANIPNNHISVLQATKQGLQRATDEAIKHNDKHQAKLLTEAAEDLRTVIHSQSKSMKQADKVFQNMMEQKEWVEIGEKIRGMTPEEIRETLAKFSQKGENVRNAVQSGIRSDVEKNVVKAYTEENSNVARKIFKQNTMDKWKQFGFDVKNDARNLKKIVGNIARLSENSTTVKRTIDSEMGENTGMGDLFFSPAKLCRKILNKAHRQETVQHFGNLAEAATDPTKLRTLMGSIKENKGLKGWIEKNGENSLKRLAAAVWAKNKNEDKHLYKNNKRQY